MRRLKHSKSTLGQGVSLLLWLGLTVIVLGCFQIFLFRTVWAENRLLFLGFLVSEIVISLLVLSLAIAKIRRNETFVCILDDELFECVCPERNRGESFRLEVEKLVCIEKVQDGESHRWYLQDDQGNRYWLTNAYRNPADTFVRRLRQLNPELEEEEN